MKNFSEGERYDSGNKERRKQVVVDYLLSLKTRRPIEVGGLVVTVEGPHAFIGQKVVQKAGESVGVLPTPERKTMIILPESEVWTVADLDDAVRHSLNVIPHTPEELGINPSDLPISNN